MTTLIERMARAHDAEDAAQRGEPNPWGIGQDDPDYPEFASNRIAAMRAALLAAREPKSDQITRAMLLALEREGVTNIRIGAAWAAWEALVDAALAEGGSNG